MNELLKRVLVGAIGIPLAFLICYLGSYYFFAVIIIISVISLIEFMNFGIQKGYKPLTIEAIVVLLIFEATFFMFLTSKDIFDSLGILVFIVIEILLIFPILFGINLIRSHENPLANISITLSGLLYVLIPFLCLMAIRQGNTFHSDMQSFIFLITYFSSIWICDSAAYFIGKPFGKHKIAPKISPKKSWEGGIAGFIASILAFFLIGHFTMLPFNTLELISFGVVIGLVGQFGDFLESGLKRDAGVKDSSNLLSEHGGMLDRMDSIMYTAPFILILLQLFD